MTHGNAGLNGGVAALRPDASWTLFLDRDGVLNRKIDNGYVRGPAMLDMLPGALQAIEVLAKRFGKLVVITNQRGIGRGLMTSGDLEGVHASLLEKIEAAGGRIDGIFACPHDLQDTCNCRKPRVGLALQARAQIPGIDFARSVLVGDSISDIAMGESLGMVTVRIGPMDGAVASDFTFPSLLDFAKFLG